jgi:hypothetical protein
MAAANSFFLLTFSDDWGPMKKWPAHGSSLISIHYRFEQSAEKKRVQNSSNYCDSRWEIDMTVCICQELGKLETSVAAIRCLNCWLQPPLSARTSCLCLQTSDHNLFTSLMKKFWDLTNKVILFSANDIDCSDVLRKWNEIKQEHVVYSHHCFLQDCTEHMSIACEYVMVSK